MCLLYVSFVSTVRPRIFLVHCLFRLLLYCARSGMNRAQVVLPGSSEIFFLSRQKLYVGMVVWISWLHSCL